MVSRRTDSSNRTLTNWPGHMVVDLAHHVDVGVPRMLALGTAVKIAHHELAIALDMTRTAIVVVQGIACTTHRRKLLRMCRGALHPGCPGSGPSRRTFQFTVPAMKPAMIASQPSSEIGSGSAWRCGGRGCGTGCGCGWGGTRVGANAARMLSRVTGLPSPGASGPGSSGDVETF